MTETITDVLKRLDSDESKLVFLKSLYTTGNRDFADLILSINPEDNGVLKCEVNYAREHGQDRRFVDLAKRFADHYYIKHGLSILLKDMVIEWKNAEIAEYVIGRFVSQADKEDSLEYAAEIAEAFGKKDKARKCLETLLEMQRDSEYAFRPAETYVKLGRYDEAIDLHLKYSTERAYGGFYGALMVAREHKPQRIKEVAQKGFDSFKPACGFWELFTECAEIVGKTEEAKKTALKAAKMEQDYYSPRSYTSLVETLVKFGYISQARKLVDDAKKRETARKNSGYYPIDNSRELAELFGLVGDTAKARNEYLGLVDRALRERWNPSNIINDVDRAYKLTGDRVFLDKKLHLYELTQKYDEASQLAAQMGNSELAGTYRTMNQMVSAMQQTQK